MSDSLRQRYEALRVDEALDAYPGLRMVPSHHGRVALRGDLNFRATGPTGEEIADSYEIEIRMSLGSATEMPEVLETCGRIPIDYHRQDSRRLCVGAPTQIRFLRKADPTLLGFINGFVVPYLYGHAFFTKYKKMPFGELDHGANGLRDQLATMFGAKTSPHAEEFLRLAGMKKRHANKWACPCDSGRRLGRCHNRVVNAQRRRAGRGWFR